MHNGQTHHDASPQSARAASFSASAHPSSRHLLPEPESDYHSDDDLDTASRNGTTGGKRKRPISVSYVSSLSFGSLLALSVIFRLATDLHVVVGTGSNTPLLASLSPPPGTWRRSCASAYCRPSCLPMPRLPPSQLALDPTGAGRALLTRAPLQLRRAMASLKTRLTLPSLGASCASSARYSLQPTSCRVPC